MQLSIPVQVGSESPEFWDLVEAQQRQYGDDAPYLRDMRRPSIAMTDLDWGKSGFEPRWGHLDTVDCAVALQPSAYSNKGVDGFTRFRQGAERRGETALVISPIGSTEDGPDNAFSVFGPSAESVSIGQTHTHIEGQRIGKKAQVRVVDGLGDADKDLALRLLSHTHSLIWRSLSLTGEVLHSVYGKETFALEGTLLPILETELGEPVVAVWISPDGVERRYIVPFETPWTVLLQWLLKQALPEFVPEAMRRARRPLASDKDLMTRRERDAHASLAVLDSDYAKRRGELERQLKDAQDTSATIRESLLYGTGQQLVDAVRLALEAADIGVIDLDEKFEDTKNADLLCSYGGQSRLVEVKSASGSAPERAYHDLLRHLLEWSSLPDATPIDGGALVISHNLRKVPRSRELKPYTRPEFLSAQTEPVISAMELFNAWRDEDMEAIRQLLFAASITPVPSPARQGSVATLDVDALTPIPVRQRWYKRR